MSNLALCTLTWLIVSISETIAVGLLSAALMIFSHLIGGGVGDSTENLASQAPWWEDLAILVALEAFAFLALSFVNFLYLAPSFIAARSKKGHFAFILMFNFLLGWTIIGWVAVLIIACKKSKNIIAVS
jgi:hypothetical protein